MIIARIDMVALTGEEARKNFCDDTIKLEEGTRQIFLLMAERLHTIRENQLYEPYWSSWQEFTMEFKDLSQASISKLIQVYEILVKEYGIDQKTLALAGGWTKLYQITRRASSREEAMQWIEKATELSRSDLEKEMKEVDTGIEMAECNHSDFIVIKVCQCCGQKERLYSFEEEIRAEQEKKREIDSWG